MISWNSLAVFMHGKLLLLAVFRWKIAEMAALSRFRFCCYFASSGHCALPSCAHFDCRQIAYFKPLWLKTGMARCSKGNQKMIFKCCHHAGFVHHSVKVFMIFTPKLPCFWKIGNLNVKILQYGMLWNSKPWKKK